MKVPMLDLAAQHEPLRADLLRAMTRVVDSSRFILGPEVERFEGRLAAACGAAQAITVSSGTDALLVSLMALGVGPGDEVVTTPFSFFATAGTIARTGATPVFADIQPDTFNLDPVRLERAITPRTRAILPVHLYGQCADMEAILGIANHRGIKVIEDAAQAIGAQYRDGRQAGTMGALGCLSFFPTKNLGGLGDGGAVLTQDRALADRVRTLRTHGEVTKYHHQFVGGNFRLDALQTAVLDVKLDHLNGWSAARRANAGRYDALIAERRLDLTARIVTPKAAWKSSAQSNVHIYNQYVIRTPQRDALRAFLAEREITTEVYYPVPVHLQECFAPLGHKAGAFPEAERAAAEVLALPVYPELTAAQQVFVVDAIEAYFKSST